LAAAFVSVALVSVAIFAVIILLSDRADVVNLAQTQRSETTSAIVSSLQSAYRANNGWSGTDLEPVAALTDLSGSAVEVDTSRGTVLLRAGPRTLLAATSALRVTLPVQSRGRTVGTVRVAFPAGGLSPAERRLRNGLEGAAGLSAALAVLGALAASALVTRLAVRPLRRLTSATRALGGGEKRVRLGAKLGPGELGELSAAFNSMAESLERQEQLRQALVADVAHELRTPIAVLQAETEALVDGHRPPDTGALTSLHDEALRLGRMVDDLQSLASADAAGLSLERRLVDLAEVASRAADALAGRFRSGGLTLGRSLAPVVVRGDASRLHQVVSNLLVNAAKFTPRGGEVGLSVGIEGSCARLEVSDSGPGVPLAEREHVFDRFYRGRAGRSSGGSGIGLAVVKQLVVAHEGEVRLGTSSAGGACFVVLLPRATDN
jgi:two-component system sensor histidine kinase BaeS